MEVKNDVSKIIEPTVTGLSTKVTSSTNETKTREVDARKSETDVDDVKLTDYAVQRQKTQEIGKANEAISSLTKVVDGVKQLSELTQSVSGIVQLASNNVTTKVQKETLGQEVKQLSSVITTLAVELRQAKVITVPEEAARMELEKNLAEALDVFLPDPPRGPAELNISTKQAIIQTRNIISKAQAQIAKLRDSLKAELDQTVEYVKVQRTKDIKGDAKKEISEADQAFKTSQTLSEEIATSPVIAQMAISGSDLTSSTALFK